MRPAGPPPGQFGMQPPGAMPMANGPPSGGIMRPPGPPGGVPGAPAAGAGFSAPGYGPSQAAAGMQQMSLGGPPGPPGGLGGPPAPPAGLAGPRPVGPPSGSFGGPLRPMMGPQSAGAPGGFPAGPPGPGGFPRGPPSSGAPGGPPPPAMGAAGPGPYSGGVPGGPRPPGPVANGPVPFGQPLSGTQQQLAAAGAPPGPGFMGPGGARPAGPQPGIAGAAAPAPGGMSGMPGGPPSGGIRPPMPGFMPPGPPGMARPAGPGMAPTGPPSGSGMSMGPPQGFGGPPPPAGAMGAPGMPGMGPPPPGGVAPGMRPPGPPGMPGAPGMAGPGYAPQMPGGMPPPGGMPAGPGMPGQGMGQAPGRQAMSARIDPTQIPRPVVNQSQEVQIFETRVNGSHVNPPSSNSRFIVRDRGNASPRLLRSTLNAVPATADVLNNSGMQFALAVQPLACPDPQDDPVQVIDLGELGPVRCGRCKAYMNPYMRWADGGKTFVCNFCGHSNPCPDPYFCYLGPDNRRRDQYERAELCMGTYEVVATKEYFARPAMPVIHVFLIDVGHVAVQSGATAATCLCIGEVLDSLQGGDNTLVGIVTYDSSVHFYNVKSGQATAQMLVMSDTQEVYAPMPSQLLAKLSESKEQLRELLASIPTMFAAAAGPESCGAAAIEACVELLKPSGGKLHAFATSLPNSGTKALKLRDSNANMPEKEKQMGLLPQDNTYATLAAQAADFQVCIDVFLLAQTYMDVATMSGLTHTTGGSMYHYLPFNPQMDQDQLLNDLKWNVSRPQGLEAIVRVRCSAGLDVEGYLGSFYKPPNSPTDLYLPAIDCDKAVIAKLAIVEKLSPNNEVYLQCATLYTTTDGARRVRISTLALPVSDEMGTVFKGADLDSQLAYITRQVAMTLPGGTPAACKELLLNRITATLTAYRKHCATSSSTVQLILPEALKLLPLYSLALHKSPVLRPDVRPDERSLWLAHVMGASCGRIMGLLHPRLFAVHQLLKAGAMPPGGAVPEPLVLSSEVLDSGGIYLLDNGADLLLFVDQDADDRMVEDLFAVPNTEALLRTPQPLPVQPHNNPGSQLLFELLNTVRLQRCSFMRLRVAKKGDPYYPLFVNLLVEDKSTAGMSYVEFLCHVHRQIQEKMG